jgi:hypothetical protein
LVISAAPDNHRLASDEGRRRPSLGFMARSSNHWPFNSLGHAIAVGWQGQPNVRFSRRVLENVIPKDRSLNRRAGRTLEEMIVEGMMSKVTTSIEMFLST